jgi:hypothetical protein
MVYGKLGFKTIHSYLTFSGDDPGIINQDVKFGVLSLEIRCQFADFGLRGKIGYEQGNTVVTALLFSFA